MIEGSQIHIGILFTAMVSMIIASAATIFFVFLMRRWRTLEAEMRAYAIFYLLTATAWSWITLRYILIGNGYDGVWIIRISQITQSLLVSTGAPLLYYVGRRIFHDPLVAKILSLVASGAAVTSIYLLFQEGGVLRPRIEFFSADGPINKISLLIFVSIVATIACLLAYDIGSRLYAWSKNRNIRTLYTALYSSGVLVYVAIGGLDQIKILTGGFLVVFRALYAASFLFTYIVIVKRESLEEDYFIEDASQI